MTSQLIGLTVSAAAGGSGKDQAVAGWVASRATKYNSLDDHTAEKLLDEVKGYKASGGCGRDKVEGIVSRYEKLSADRSQPIQGCEFRACVEAIWSNTIAMDDPVARKLMNTLRRSVAYDVPGLLQGDQSKIAMPSLGVDKWGSLYVSDKDLMQAKYTSEGWLTPQERVGLAKWDKETDWLNRLAGKKLSVEEKANRLVELTSTAGMGIIAKGGSGGVKGRNSVTKRPSGFRKQTVKDSWENAATGSTSGSKACPTCGRDVNVAPGQGRRDWDVKHQPPWSQRDLSGKTRSEVLDAYNKGTRLECPGCNPSRGARPAD